MGEEIKRISEAMEGGASYDDIHRHEASTVPGYEAPKATPKKDRVRTCDTCYSNFGLPLFRPGYFVCETCENDPEAQLAHEVGLGQFGSEDVESGTIKCTKPLCISGQTSGLQPVCSDNARV